jgi:two-component system response regulator AtoC
LAESKPTIDTITTAEVAPTSTDLRLQIVGDGVYGHESIPSVGTLELGRAHDSDVCIDDPSISRSHAKLHLDGPLRVEDLGSANGTWVRGERIAVHELVELKLGEPFRVGEVTLILQRRPAQMRVRRLRTHDYFLDRVEDECARADRSEQSFAVAHIVLDAAASEREALQTKVAAAMRHGDVVAVYAPDELEVLLVDAKVSEREQVSARIARTIEATGARARLGFAWWPEHGRDASALCETARSRAFGAPDGNAGTNLVVADAQMTALHELVAKIAKTDITVLLLGETGVGKEVFAEQVHRLSARADKPFVRLNCGALTESLLESELFGYERGAFTGADAPKQGLFEAANHGVIFLDEVGELRPTTQVKLLRVLDEHKVMRVGGVKARPIDVRLVAATNRDLQREVDRGAFRLDLLYRLNAMSIVVPPLRERVAEIRPLAQGFLRAAAAKMRVPAPELSDAALAALERYSWPGNVRELRNVIDRAVILCANGRIEPGDLPIDKMGMTFVRETVPPPISDERDRIVAALEACAGNQTQAARMLGIARRTLVTKLEKFAMPRPRKGTRK